MGFPNKKYNTIVIDPPWGISMMGHRDRRSKQRKKLPYKTMSLQEIKELPIQDICEPGCHVYLWTTNKMIRDAFDVFDAWGIRFHLMMPWVKPSGISPCFGYVFASEFCLMGINGRPMQKFLKCGQLNWIKDINMHGKHSSKPDQFYNLLEEMSPSPRIDIFARKRRPGWDAWGDQLPPDTQNKCCQFKSDD